jgi:hypothetical protein
LVAWAALLIDEVIAMQLHKSVVVGLAWIVLFAASAASSQASSCDTNGSDLRVCAFVFEGLSKDGDFLWMIQQSEFQDVLFVFNDNEQQFYQHRDRPYDSTSDACEAGGGNAIIRPFQCKRPQHASGIPTGPGYDHLTPHVQAVVDDAVEQIAEVLSREKLKRIFYNSKSDAGDLGYGIFQTGDDVRRYIVAKLRALEKP